MSDINAPGPEAVPHPPPAAPAAPPSSVLTAPERDAPRIDVREVERSQIIIAGRDVNMRKRLPETGIPQADLDVVSLAWVDTDHDGGAVTVPGDAVSRLTSDGPALAVITGPAGYGKRTAAIRTLWQVSRTESSSDGKPLPLSVVQPDWDKPGAPDIGSLPDRPGTGYLLDVAAEISGWDKPDEVAKALVTHAEKLHRVGSFLVVVADEHSWPEDESGTLGRVVVRAKNRPAPHRVAVKHLENLHRKPERIRWLNTATNADGEGMVGQAAHLLSDASSPTDAVRLADELARTENSADGLKTAMAAFQQWRTQVVNVFKQTGPGDRALLIANLFLSGGDATSIQNASYRLLGKGPQEDVEVILSGPDLATRLRSIGAQVTGRQTTLDHRPGYAQAVLNHLWQQRPDIHRHLLKWLDTITSPGEPGASRLAAVSTLLVELAITQNDIKVIDQIRTWIDNGNTTTEHRELIAGVFAQAAEADTLGPKVRSRLLDWAQVDSASVSTVVALVCQSEFAEHYPRQTLVRLRHILDRAEADTAVRTAEAALRTMAARPGQLPRVWATVSKWATEPGHLAGHRAFLSLLDPRDDAHALQVLMAAADEAPEIRAALLRGWHAALADTRVASQCRDLMIAWARARAEGLVPQGLVTDILRQVVTEHLYTSPVAALVFGEPGVQYDEPVIALRRDLQLPVLAQSPPPAAEAAES